MPAWFALKPALGLLKRAWWAIPIIGLVIALLITRHTLSGRTEALEACKTNHAQFVADVAARTDEARRLDAAHKAQVEATQDKVSANASKDYQTELAALRARYDRLRVQPKADSGSRGGTTMPVIPDATSGPDVATSSAPLDGFACEANTLQLGGLQGWVRDQQAITR